MLKTIIGSYNTVAAQEHVTIPSHKDIMCSYAQVEPITTAQAIVQGMTPLADLGQEDIYSSPQDELDTIHQVFAKLSVRRSVKHN